MNMYQDNYAPWEHFPKTLSRKEMQQPMSVLRAFYGAGRVKDHQKTLNEWHSCVVSETVYHSDVHGPGFLLFFYELNLKLLEAAFLLLLDNKQDRWELKPVHEDLFNGEPKALDFLNNLFQAQQSDPYETIEAIFEKISPQLYRDYLQEWIHSAFYNHPIDEAITAEEVILVYENLLKLYSVGWVILHNKENNEI